jgi:hypothetical protein
MFAVPTCAVFGPLGSCNLEICGSGEISASVSILEIESEVQTKPARSYLWPSFPSSLASFAKGTWWPINCPHLVQ